jgi:chloramphenicol 3-O phosphotransferase
MYIAMYKAIASFSSSGLNVVVDVGHHDGYSVTRNILKKCAEILKKHTVLFVGVRCPIETVMKRRTETWGAGYNTDGSIPKPIMLWQQLVHEPGIYDIELDTSILSSKECAELIRQRLKKGGPCEAFDRIRGSD